MHGPRRLRARLLGRATRAMLPWAMIQNNSLRAFSLLSLDALTARLGAGGGLGEGGGGEGGEGGGGRSGGEEKEEEEEGRLWLEQLGPGGVQLLQQVGACVKENNPHKHTTACRARHAAHVATAGRFERALGCAAAGPRRSPAREKRTRRALDVAHAHVQLFSLLRPPPPGPRVHLVQRRRGAHQARARPRGERLDAGRRDGAAGGLLRRRV